MCVCACVCACACVGMGALRLLLSVLGTVMMVRKRRRPCNWEHGAAQEDRLDVKVTAGFGAGPE